MRRLGGCTPESAESFHLDDELWARGLGFRLRLQKTSPVEGMILRSLTPLYLVRVASFVGETETLVAAEVEEKIEQLCLIFENRKPHLTAQWNEDSDRVRASQPPQGVEQRELHEENMEV